MLIRRATLPDGAVVDIRLGDTIEQIAESLPSRRGEEVLDAGFGTVIPGLHDHHLHVYSAAAEQDSIRVGPAEVADEAGLVRALASAVVGSDGWIRAVGYHEAVAGPLDRHFLDRLVPGVPVRVQHRSGVLWTLNSPGLVALGMGDHPDGRLRSADHTWSDTLQRRPAAVAEFSARLAGYGVTGVTDATPDLQSADRPVGLRQRLHCLAPGKRILHDDGLDLDALTAWISERHRAGEPVAVHCVTSAQLVVTIAALRAAGGHPADRIEHAAMVPADCIADLVELGVTVVTQPNFVAERGDQYRTDVPGAEQDQLWRLASLLAAGVPVALSTDAPFGAPDPWAAMRAAVHRRSPSGVVLNPDERISGRRALTLFLGSAGNPARPRRITPGEPGDLCLLAASPQRVFDVLDAELVATTIVGGVVVFER
ncbi:MULTISPECIES: amidohydrolase family protein [unclassified Mycolicibacterium]|uniref:amidohydrolase family protein n=1 Tax=unclassified Mycolicibacterium TaxID=2636767 RepID=UPI0012DED5E9|nr:MULTISPECIES: amidohydrolase family protein [unclassified Mycolicibacterium]MUL82702.1 amidohydrolase family protein [Mycolicibacterium sp. CBMA 329]MUL89037.1 amidohydrolase family protein [Mycolicibacterium sp. CBMA 331]MUL97604.1 amidohydrolase family protein [Mycolicibacterium sp. CBMA 334]MUM29363.1 amidohydrolase family protein [Mycolicibacterium sp. CBMA 295]MUM38553.1 amidohydrolase family protein [Mycolicibacterium sp. CBMA 247]